MALRKRWSASAGTGASATFVDGDLLDRLIVDLPLGVPALEDLLGRIAPAVRRTTRRLVQRPDERCDQRCAKDPQSPIQPMSSPPFHHCMTSLPRGRWLLRASVGSARFGRSGLDSFPHLRTLTVQVSHALCKRPHLAT